MGIAVSEAERQLAQLRDPPPPIRLVRPCGPSDGIRLLAPEDHPRLLAGWRRMAEGGRLLKLVPASGAASRMFHDLESLRGEQAVPSPAELASRAAGGDQTALNALHFLRELDRFAFYRRLAAATGRDGREIGELAARGDLATLLHYTLSPAGLGYSNLPKGLIEFHRYPAGCRTAFAEHLAESRGYLAAERGRCRLHFTVSPEHRQTFRESSQGTVPELEEAFAASFDLSFSTQEPSGDTLAVDPQGRPFRTADGRLLLRPGGHGALIDNLQRLGGDVVIIKNVDNVAHQRLHDLVGLWKRLLIGYLGHLESRSFELLDALADGGSSASPIAEALEFLTESFALELPAAATGTELRDLALDRLRRPLRICGVVRNRGEPGGGPFWVRDSRGQVSGQIVEPAQVDGEDRRQAEIWRSSTHFNPVDLVCGLRDLRGEPYDLAPFVDPSTAFVAEKTFDGRPLRALERPGLWNGAMAGWNTAFVEVPEETFSPVKTVLDLLRPPHQPS